MGAVQKYDTYPAVMKVLSLMSEGRSVSSSCDEVGITVPAFRSVIDSDPVFVSMYDEAVTRGHDALADALLEIDRHPHYGSSDTKQQKVTSDNIKWVLSKRDSKRFGERVAVDVNVTADRAIVEALSRRRSRSEQRQISEIIDVTPTTVVDAGANEDAELAALLS